MGGKEHRQYEFFGPIGTSVLTIVLPFVPLGLVYGCNSSGCLQLYPSISVPGFPAGQSVYTHEAMVAVAGWLAVILALHLLVPGKHAQGVVLPGGRRLTYKLNAFSVFAIVYSSALVLGFGTSSLDLGWLHDNYLPLAAAAVILSSALAALLYAASFARGRVLAAGANTGCPPYDFFLGRELNPRVGALDLKEWCELQPGMIGWALLNLGCLARQRSRLGYVTNSMLLVNAFELWYVADALYNERSILTTMDITSDGFGFMLAFGDLAWVPFTFATQARFLADYPQDLSWPALAGVLAVQALGYWIFRSANNEKDAFRRDPASPVVSHLRSMPTARGTRLIISGWWGAARHINYLGDWIMGLAWCLPTGLAGLQSVVPFFYAMYFGVLLVHRERRDDHACALKYGADWAKYCELVPWRIVPRVY